MDHLYPHGRCFLWNDAIISWHVAADSLTAISYLVISAVLFIFCRHIVVSQIVSRWAFTSFGTFIFACAMTHIMDIIVIWWPIYIFQGFVKMICAAASLSTGVVICNLLRKFIQEEDKMKDRSMKKENNIQ